MVAGWEWGFGKMAGSSFVCPGLERREFMYFYSVINGARKVWRLQLEAQDD